MNTTVSIKSIEGNKAVVAGYGVVFGGVDITGDTFTPETEFHLKRMAEIPVFYSHTLPTAGGAIDEQIGVVTSYEVKDAGLWLEAEIELSDEYRKAIMELAQQGRLGWSSGAVSHLVRKEKHAGKTTLKSWPIAEFSLTTIPADPRTIGVQRIKTATEAEQDAPQDSEAETQAVAASQPRIEVLADSSIEGEPIMAENTTGADNAQVTALNEQVKHLSAQVAAILSAAEDAPAPVKGLPMVSQVGGKADRRIKSFGDFLVSVKRGDTDRLDSVYNAVKALSEDAGASGGYLVPPDFQTRIFELVYRAEPWLSRVSRVQVNTSSGTWPALDITFTPTAGVGQTAAAGRMTGAKRVEGGAFTNTDPVFQQIEWKLRDVVSGKTSVSIELMQDSATALEGLLMQLISRVDAAKQAFYFLRGSGSGEPLGILNADAYTTQAAVTNNVFSVADAAAMLSKFQSFGDGVWVAHRTNLPDIAKLEVSAGGAAYMANTNTEIGNMPLYGYPISWTEHLPVTDNTGSLILIDPSAYQVWERPLAVSYSEHADFENGNVMWRFSHRLDGQPLLRGTIKQGNPGTAHQMSAFVGFTFAT